MAGDIISISIPPFPDFIEGNYRTMRKGQSHVDRRNLGYFDLIVVEKGCLFLAEENERYEIRENEMFILLPDRHHYSCLLYTSKVFSEWLETIRRVQRQKKA